MKKLTHLDADGKPALNAQGEAVYSTLGAQAIADIRQKDLNAQEVSLMRQYRAWAAAALAEPGRSVLAHEWLVISDDEAVERIAAGIGLAPGRYTVEDVVE